MSFLIFQISTLRSAEVSSFDIAGARGDAWSRCYMLGARLRRFIAVAARSLARRRGATTVAIKSGTEAGWPRASTSGSRAVRIPPYLDLSRSLRLSLFLSFSVSLCVCENARD